MVGVDEKGVFWVWMALGMVSEMRIKSCELHLQQDDMFLAWDNMIRMCCLYQASCDLVAELTRIEDHNMMNKHIVWSRLLIFLTYVGDVFFCYPLSAMLGSVASLLLRGLPTSCLGSHTPFPCRVISRSGLHLSQLAR